MRPLIGQSVCAGTRSDLRTTRTDPRPLGRVRVGLSWFWVGSVTCVSPHSVGEPSAKLTYCFQSCRIAPGFAVSDTVLKIPIPVILVRIGYLLQMHLAADGGLGRKSRILSQQCHVSDVLFWYPCVQKQARAAKHGMAVTKHTSSR